MSEIAKNASVERADESMGGLGEAVVKIARR